MNFRNFVEADDQRPEIKIVDTQNVTPDMQRTFGNSVICGNGYLIGYHVTDNPEEIQGAVAGPRKIISFKGPGRSRFSELGPGFYVSGVPDFWKNRSANKWSFLHKLTPQESQRLAHAILMHPTIAGQVYKDKDGSEQRRMYLTKWEAEAAIRDVNDWLKLKTQQNKAADSFIVTLAGQPYNIPFWQPQFLAKIGITPGRQPDIMKVILRGKFADLSFNSHHHVTVIAKLIKSGIDGGFIRGGYVGDPQLVVWNKNAITQMGIDDEVA